MIQQNIDLAAHNTLHFPGKASHYLTIETVEQIAPAVAWAKEHQIRHYVLGGGSNIVITQDIGGLVLKMVNKGIEVTQNEHTSWLRVAAGEVWHDLVMWALEHGYFGLENLALIPGSVGAAPIQNIGAYGLEVCQFIQTVHVFDALNEQWVDIDHKDCEFAYRNSVFKRHPHRFIVHAVTFALPRQWAPCLQYKELQMQFANDISTATPQAIFDCVVNVRRAKLPNPNEVGNVGSFFHNPVIPLEQLHELQKKFPDIVFYRQGESCKLAAGWLIERCGWKGYSEVVGGGKIGVHDRQSLVLLHFGGGLGRQLLDLANRIVQSVDNKFGVQLTIEPDIW